MLASRFNGSIVIKETRDTSQLKARWKNLKVKAKKKRQKRGGVNFKPTEDHPPMIMEPLSKKIIHMIPQQISPLPNPYYDDGALENCTASEAPTK